jgi:hypothetical protein
MLDVLRGRWISQSQLPGLQATVWPIWLAAAPDTALIACACALALAGLFVFGLGLLWSRRPKVTRERASRKGHLMPMTDHPFDEVQDERRTRPLPPDDAEPLFRGQRRADGRARDERGERAHETEHLRRLRKLRRKYIDEAFDALDFAFEGAGGLIPRWRHREFQEQVRMDLVILRELVERLRALKEDADALNE